jgi:hypothetical protein
MVFSLAYKRPVFYGLKINTYRSNGLKTPFIGAVKHGLWKPENPRKPVKNRYKILENP